LLVREVPCGAAEGDVLTVGNDVTPGGLPEALLEAQNMRGGSQAGTAFSTKLSSQSGSFDQGYVVLVPSKMYLKGNTNRGEKRQW
jgi:hypothetical protein